MLIYVGEPHYQIIVAEEGTGDNLLPEDIEEGYVDYFMTSAYKQECDELELIDSGQMLCDKLIEDMETREMIDLLMDYHYGYTPKNYVLLEH